MAKKLQKTITAESIDKVLKFLPVFEKKGYSFSKWEGGKTENGISSFPFCSYNKEVSVFQHILYEEGFIVDFDWPNWQEEAERYYQQPKLLDQADLETICRLLTTHVRKDRFCEGHLACMLRDGHIAAILHRLKEIR